MYRIKIKYQTGDSFSNRDAVTYLDIDFKKLEVAEDNILRIKNHYEYYKKHDDMWSKPDEELLKGVCWNDEYRSITLETIDDNGNLYLEIPEWIGYFETLYSAQIEFKGMRYEP